MTETSPLIFFGWNKKGEKVFVPLFHLFINATSGAGKTVILKHLLWRFSSTHPDWSILIIDSKDKREFADLNSDIPLCFVETTEPLDLKDLMEPLLGSKTLYYLDKIIEEAVFDTLEEIQRVIEQKIEGSDSGKMRIHSKELGKLRVINHTFKKIIAFIKQFKVTNELKLKPGFNVLNVSLPGAPLRLKTAFQQLILRSTLVMLMQPQYEKVLFVHDEFHKSSPQRWSSIVKQPMSDGISEGRSKEVFFWLADQAMTKVDKEPLKPVKIWVVGQQMEDNEVNDAVKSVNDITDLKVGDKDIKRLRVGNFLVVDGVNMQVEEAYFQPNGVPDELAIEIAKGNKKPQEAESYLKSFKFQITQIEDEKMIEDLKVKLSEEKGKRDQAEKDRDRYKLKFEELEKSFPNMRSQIYNEVMEKIEKDLAENYIDKSQHTKIIEELNHTHQKELKSLEKAQRLYDALADFVNTELEKREAHIEAIATQPIDVTSLLPLIDERIRERIITEKEIQFVEVTVDNRIKELVKTDFLKPIFQKIQSFSEVAKKSARFIYEKKTTTIGELYFFLYQQRTGRPRGTFQIHALIPLEQANFIFHEGEKIKWILPQTLRNLIENTEEIEKTEKYIVSLLF